MTTPHPWAARPIPGCRRTGLSKVFHLPVAAGLQDLPGLKVQKATRAIPARPARPARPVHRGPAGVDGTPGVTGPQGPQGPAGANGSPDTAAQILAKLVMVDGSGSNLDADKLDGQDSAWYRDWANLTNKPATFPPTLPIAESGVTNLTTDLAARLLKAGDTMGGPLILAADPGVPLEAATKQYVDNKPSGGVTVSDTAPGSPTANMLWVDSTTMTLLVWYNDGDTSQWVQVGGTSG